MGASGCPFCEIAAGRAPAEFALPPDHWPETLVFRPLRPVVEGHLLVVPKVHVTDFADDPEVYGKVSQRAGELMRFSRGALNVITSRGEAATQSVFHLHVHLVPRSEGDGLALPWYSGRPSKKRRRQLH